MLKEGSLVRVFKKKYNDDYHNIGEYKYGKIIKKYPNFFLVRMEDKYDECFKEYELEEIKGNDYKNN